uniref:Putative secreted protein n=1 Tax=Anopheles marajoara TaxID=58244 RepID=A0A2M4CFS5_9DIPT
MIAHSLSLTPVHHASALSLSQLAWLYHGLCCAVSYLNSNLWRAWRVCGFNPSNSCASVRLGSFLAW